MHPVVLAVTAGIFVVVGYHDVRTRRIPNELSLAIAGLGLARIALAADMADAGYSLAAAAMIFAVTFALFRYGAFGGGDAKIIPATALLIGYRELLDFLFLMSLCGAALALATIATEKLGAPVKRLCLTRHVSLIAETKGKRAPAKGSTVPYGVAVAAAGVLTLLAAR